MTDIFISKRDWDTGTEGRPCEDTGESGHLTSQGGRPQKELTCQHLDLGFLMFKSYCLWYFVGTVPVN